MKNIQLTIKPLSLWLSYNILSPNKIQELLPDGMKLAKVKILQEDKHATHKLMYNCYNLDSFWMKGARLEIMTIAKKDDQLHFVVLDCITNTMQWNPIDGIEGPNGVIKFNYKNEILNYNILRQKEFLDITGIALENANMTKDFAIESNYACYFKNADWPVRLTFDEEQIMTPVRKLRLLNIKNDFWSKFRYKKPSHVFFHEHPMVFKTY